MNSCKTFALTLFALFLLAARPSEAQLRKSFDAKCKSCPALAEGQEECNDGLIETECFDTMRCCPFHGWGTKKVIQIDTSVTSDEPVKPVFHNAPPIVIEDEPFSSASIVKPFVSMTMALAATILFF